MKQKKTSKLSLNKTTVANLNSLQMRGVVGAGITDTCPSLEPPTCKPHICNSLECPTANTDDSQCDCTTLELECPSNTCPAASCETCVSCYC